MPETRSPSAEQVIELAAVHEGGEEGEPDIGVGDRRHRHLQRRSVGLQQPQLDAVAATDAEPLGHGLCDQDAGARDGQRPQPVIERSRQLGQPVAAEHRHPPGAGTGADLGGGGAKRLGAQHAGEAAHCVHGAVGPHLGEGQRHVLALGAEEVGIDHELGGVEHAQRGDQDGHGRGDAEHRGRRAQRPAQDVAQDHARGLIERGARGEPLQEGAPIHRRRRRAHGLGRLQPHGLAHAGGGADDGRRQLHQHHQHQVASTDAVVQEREAIVLGIAPRDLGPGRGAEQHAQHHPGADDHGHQREIMQRDLGIGIAQRLEHADALALGLHMAQHQRVQHEGHQTEIDRGGDAHRRLQLLDLAGQGGVRDLIAAAIGADAAVGCEQRIHARDHRCLVGALGQAQDHLIEGPLQIERGGQRAAVHPQHAEALIVRHHGAGHAVEDILGR
jgi:hypothetical protein